LKSSKKKKFMEKPDLMIVKIETYLQVQYMLDQYAEWTVERICEYPIVDWPSIK